MKEVVFWGLMTCVVLLVLGMLGIFFRLALAIVALLLLPFTVLFHLVFSKTVLVLFLAGLVVYCLVSRRRKIIDQSRVGDLGLSMAHLEARLDRFNGRI